MPMRDAIARFVPDGASVAMGTALEALIPFGAGHELIRQGRRDLSLIGPGQAAEERCAVVLPRSAAPGGQVVLEVRIATGGLANPVERNLGDALVFLTLIPLAELVEGMQAWGGWPTVPLW